MSAAPGAEATSAPTTPERPVRTLYQRVVIAFALFSFGLSTVFAVAVWGALHMAEDRMIERTLRLELEAFLERRQQDPQASPASTPWLHGTLEPSRLPEPLQPFTDSSDGFFEVVASPCGTQILEPFFADAEEFSLLIHTLERPPDTKISNSRVYLYVDTTKVEVLEESTGFMKAALLTMIALVPLLGVLLGRSTARRVIAPVTQLADRVRQRSINPQDPSALSAGLAADEVGLLAQALEESEARSRSFLDRERRFTRDASHELRSPVTIVRGAVELLETRPEATIPAIARPLARIRRAADQMSRLIEAFLWLAREEALSEGGHAIRLEPEVEDAIERYRHLLEGKAIELHLEVDPSAGVASPQGVVGIVLGNLISNAFFYTADGQIRIQANNQYIQIDDTGPGIPLNDRPTVVEPHMRGRQSDGFGLGLAICRDLCERFGWRLELSAGEGSSGTRAKICFTPKTSENQTSIASASGEASRNA